MRSKIIRHPMLLAALVATTALIAGCGASTSSPSTANAADRAFVQQMIPHHMMAVQMAQTAGQHGGHPQIKTLAAGIITDQQAEIAQMTPIAQTIGVKPDAMPMGGQMSSGMMTDANTLGLSMNQMGISMNMTSLGTARPFDRAFIDMMIPTIRARCGWLRPNWPRAGTRSSAHSAPHRHRAGPRDRSDEPMAREVVRRDVSRRWGSPGLRATAAQAATTAWWRR